MAHHPSLPYTGKHHYFLTFCYVVANPVRAGLVEHPSDYAHLGSQRYTIDELLKICEYSNSWV
jgi:hypothetical protein